MNSEKVIGSEISDEQSNQQEAQHDTARTKHSYDCTFCQQRLHRRSGFNGGT